MASLTPPEGTSVNLPLDAYKASALPEGINLMQLTINGPRSTTLRDIEIAIAEGKHLCFHLLKEEYDHLPKSIMQPDGEGVIISEANQVSLIRNLEGDLRKPWLHLSGHQHIMDAIGQTSWLLSEGRLVSAHLEESYIVIVEPCIFGNFHDLCELKGITFFNRHHGAKAIQLMSGSIWDLTSTEIKNQMLIRVCGDITQIFDTFNWKNQHIWDYHLCMDIKGILQDPHPEAFIEHIKDTVHHAGLHIVSSASPLADDIKKGIIDLCCRYNIGIHRPKNPDIARFRGSDGHRAYILDHIKETLENHPPSAEEHPCVPSYLMEEDIEMEEDNEPSSAAAFNIL